MKKYIQQSAFNILKEKKEFYMLSGHIPVYIINKISSNIDFNNVIKTLEENVPSFIISLIEGVYIGDFEDLKERNIQAMYKDGVIYLSNFKDVLGVSEELIAGNITHELAHAVEENYGHEIYSDKKIQKEYDGKKKKLYFLLKAEGYNIPEKVLFDESYVDELDTFLYNKVGYDKLSLMIPGLFMSPYSVTSMREYFANGVEDYLLGDLEHLKQVSPVLYRKIDNFIDQVTS